MVRARTCLHGCMDVQERKARGDTGDSEAVVRARIGEGTATIYYASQLGHKSETQ